MPALKDDLPPAADQSIGGASQDESSQRVSSGKVSADAFPPLSLATTTLAAALIVAGSLPWIATLRTGQGTGWLGIGLVAVQAAVTAAILWLFGRLMRSQRFEMQAAMRRSSRSVQNAEKRLRRSERSAERSVNIVQQLSRGVVLLSGDRRIEMLNAAATELLRLGNHPTTGTPWAEVVRDPSLLAAVGDAGDPVSSSRQTIDWVDDSGVRPLQFAIGPLDPSDPPASGELLIEIEDRSEARAVDRIRREFVANVSHELKTPLAAIKGYAETIDLAIDDDLEAARHFVAQIFTQCRRLEALIASVMQLARAQEGPGNLRIEPVDLVDVLNQAVQTHRTVAQQNGLRLITSDSWPSTAMAMADREATLTMANNLIGNAVRYTPEGGEIRVELVSEPTMQKFKVRDTGIGIEADEQQRIFERFYRAAATRRSDSVSLAKGTGLGLSIVKNLAISQGGTLGVDSRPGHGSTFWVRLPRADD